MTNAAHELVRTVRIGEGVKQIVMVAGRVRSIATNAILLAHRAGNLARGFGVLSRELRGFTDQVTAQMNILSECTCLLVSEVSASLRVSHRTQLLARTRDLVNADTAAANTVTAVLSRHASGAEAQSISIEKLHMRLGAALAATDQVTQFGTVLARTALIEAAYGGEHSQALSGVAQEFNQCIAQIIETLQSVRRASHSHSVNEAAVAP